MSFSRAAEELFLTQPAVSIQVRQLEEHFGIALFAHVGRRILLTPAGREMLRYARAIIDNFRAAEEAMERAQGAAREVLRVGIEPAGGYVFPRLMAAFTGRGNRTELELAVHERDELVDRLKNHEFDLAIVTDRPSDISVESTAFAPHAFVLVASANHPLAHQQRIRPEALQDEPLITYDRSCAVRELMEAVMHWHPQRTKPTLAISDTETIKQLIRERMGIGFLSAHTVSREVESGVLSILDVEHFPHIAQWHVAQYSGRMLPVSASEFRHFLLRDGARELDEPRAKLHSISQNLSTAAIP